MNLLYEWHVIVKIVFVGQSGLLGSKNLKAIIRSDASVLSVVAYKNRQTTKLKVASALWTFVKFIPIRNKFLHSLSEYVQTNIVRMAKLESIPVHVVNTVNSNVLEAIIDRCVPDVVVATWPEKIPVHLLKKVSNGWINVHTSYLPRHKGGSPHIWTILNGDQYAGVTIHKMSDKIDNGPILSRKKVLINNDITGQELFHLLCEQGSQLLYDEINSGGIINPLLYRSYLDEVESYEPIWKRGIDGKISWEMSAVYIDRIVRSSYISPGYLSNSQGAFFNYKKRKVIIWESSVIIYCDKGNKCGEILHIGKEGVLLKCRTGAILIRTVKDEVFKRSPRISSYLWSRINMLKVGNVIDS